MKIITTIATLAAAASAVAIPDVMSNDWANAGACAAKNPSINAAIQAFCAKTDTVVPSNYAHVGKKSGGVHVHISGYCSPPQWVPSTWCDAQFHAICAQSPGGFGDRRYGNNDCQHFMINKVA